MAFDPNTITINVGSTHYACCHLPVEAAQYMPPSQRESFIDYADATEPVCIRVFVTQSQFNALADGIKSAATPVGFTFGGMTFNWPPDSAAPASINQTTTEQFYLIRSNIAVQALVEPILELLFCNYVWWYRQYTGDVDTPFNLLDSTKTVFVDDTSAPISGTTPTNYQDVFDAWNPFGSGFFGALPFTPVTAPLNASMWERTPATEMGRLLQPLGIYPYRDPWSNGATLIELNAGDPDGETANLKLLAGYAGHMASGNSLTDNVTPTAFAPLSVVVSFPSPSLGFANFQTGQQFEINNPATSGMGNFKEGIFVRDHFFVAGKTYTEDLEDIANERAEQYFKRANIVPAVWMFAGAIKVPLGNTIRRVRISCDCVPGQEGATGMMTTVWQHGRFDVVREGLADKFNFGKTQVSRWPEIATPYGSGLIGGDDGVYDILPPQSDLIGLVTSYAQDGSNFRWTYQMDQAIKTGPGFTGWTSAGTNGVSGNLYNLIEYNNGATGLFGNGVNSTNLTGTGFTIQPIPVGTPVVCKKILVYGSPPVYEYWTQYENGLDGSCTPPGGMGG